MQKQHDSSSNGSVSVRFGVWLGAMVAVSAAFAVPIQWDNTNLTGNWNVPGNWIGGVAPQMVSATSTDNVIVDGETETNVVTTTGNTFWLDTLQVSAGDVIQGTASLRFSGLTNTWSNAGTISGTGSIDLQSGAGVTNTNSGTLEANVGSLQFGGAWTYTINNTDGMVRAVNGGQLQLRTRYVTFIGGQLSIDSASSVVGNDVQSLFEFQTVATTNNGTITWDQAATGGDRVKTLTFSGTGSILNSPTGTLTIDQGADVSGVNRTLEVRINDTASFTNQGEVNIIADGPADGTGVSPAILRIAATAAPNFSNTGMINVTHTATTDPAHIAQLVAAGSIGNAGTINVDGVSASIELGTNDLTQTAGLLSLTNGGSVTAGAVTVNGGTLRGDGTATADVAIGASGTIVPGASAGTLTINGDLILANASVLDFELGSPAGPNDLISVSGALTLDGVLNITDLGGFGGGLYTLIQYGGPLLDSGLTLGSMPRGGQLIVGGGTVQLLVPEPATIALLALALATLLRR